MWTRRTATMQALPVVERAILMFGQVLSPKKFLASDTSWNTHCTPTLPLSERSLIWKLTYSKIAPILPSTTVQTRLASGGYIVLPSLIAVECWHLAISDDSNTPLSRNNLPSSRYSWSCTGHGWMWLSISSRLHPRITASDVTYNVIA